VGTATCMLVSSASASLSAKPAADQPTRASLSPLVAGCATESPQAMKWSGGVPLREGEGVLACSVQLGAASGHGTSGRGARGGSSKGGCLGVSLVWRRHGYDVSASLSAVTVHGGQAAHVAARHPCALMLASRAGEVSGMLQQCAARAGAAQTADDMQRMAGDLEQLEDAKALHLHLTRYSPGHVPARRAPLAVSLDLACLALRLDVDLASAVTQRARLWASPSPPAQGQRLDRAAPPLDPARGRDDGMHTPDRGPDGVPRTGQHAAPGEAAGGCLDLDDMMNGLQLDVHVGLVTGVVGQGRLCAPPARPPSSAHPPDLDFALGLRATCGGARVLWNRVGNVDDSGGVGVVRLDYVHSYAVAAGAGATGGAPLASPVLSAPAAQPNYETTGGAPGAAMLAAPVLSMMMLEKGGADGGAGHGTADGSAAPSDEAAGAVQAEHKAAGAAPRLPPQHLANVLEAVRFHLDHARSAPYSSGTVSCPAPRMVMT